MRSEEPSPDPQRFRSRLPRSAQDSDWPNCWSDTTRKTCADDSPRQAERVSKRPYTAEPGGLIFNTEALLAALQRESTAPTTPYRIPHTGLANAAGWNALPGVEGFHLDLHEGHLTLSPRLPGTWRSTTAPVFAPTFWGRVDYKPTARGGHLTLRVDRLIAMQAATGVQKVTGRAELALKSLRVPGPPPRPDNPRPAVFVSLGQNPVGHRVTLETSGDLHITFETPLTLNAGDRLEVIVR